MSQVKAGAAYVELLLRNKRFLAGLKDAKVRLEVFAGQVRSVGRALVGIGVGGVVPLLAVSKAAATAGAAISDLSDRTSIPASSLTELGYVAQQTGTDLNTLGGALYRMRRRIANAASGGGPAARAMRMLGDEAKAITELPVEDQFKEIVKRLAEVDNESMRAQYAFEIFGDQAKAILPMLNLGAAGIEAFREEAKQFGLTLPDSDVESLAALDNAFGNIKMSMAGLVNQIGAALAPALTEVANVVRIYLKQAIDWVKANRQTIVTIFQVAAGAIAAGATLLSLAGVINLVAMTVASVIVASAAFASALSGIVSIAGAVSKSLAAIVSGGALGGMRAFGGVLKTVFKAAVFLLNPFTKLGAAFRIARAAGGAMVGAIQAGLGTLASVWARFVAGATFGNFIRAQIAVAVAALAGSGLGRAFESVSAAIAHIRDITSSVVGYLSDVFGDLFADVAEGAEGIASAFGEAVTDMVSRFGELRDVASETWGGIVNAVRSGDLGAAASVAMAALKMAWAEGTQWVLTHWHGMKNSVLDTADAMMYGLAGLMADGWASVETVWVETFDFLFDTWDVFVGALQRSWHSTVGFIKKAWVRLKSLFDSDVNVDAEINRINQETAAKREGTFSGIADRDQARRARRAKIEQDRLGTRQALADMRAAGQQGREAVSSAATENATKALENAREEWQAALKAANEAKPPEMISKMAEQVEEGGEKTMKRIEASPGSVDTAATFSAAAIRGMGASSLADRQLRATEEVAKNTAKLVDLTDDGGLSFT